MKSNRQGPWGHWSTSLHFSSQCKRTWAVHSGGWARKLSGVQGHCWGFRIITQGCNWMLSGAFRHLIISISHLLFINTRNVFSSCLHCPFMLHQYYALPTFYFMAHKMPLAKFKHHVTMGISMILDWEGWSPLLPEPVWASVVQRQHCQQFINRIKPVNPQRCETKNHVMGGRCRPYHSLSCPFYSSLEGEDSKW